LGRWLSGPLAPGQKAIRIESAGDEGMSMLKTVGVIAAVESGAAAMACFAGAATSALPRRTCI
jgi:hypothetical protein